MRWTLGLIAALALGLAFGPAGCKSKEQTEADATAKKAESAGLQGKWRVVSRTGDEEEGDEPPEPTAYYVIDGDLMKFVFKGKDGKEEEYGRKRMALMPDREPKQVDLTYVDEAGKPLKERKSKKGITGKRKTTTSDMKDVAIYKLDGDKLTLAISFDEKSRPAAFTAAKGSSSYVLTLERIKDGTPGPAVVPETSAAPAGPSTPATGK